MSASSTEAGMAGPVARGGGQRLSLTVIVLTFNEEAHIERCISSVRELAERIVVIDSFSTDTTAEIARRLGAETYFRAFKHQADQLQWALENCGVRSAWVLRLDADEYLEPCLADEIWRRLPELGPEITGVCLKRKVIFNGRWIRRGGYYPLYFLRLWRNGSARVEQRWMDEHIVSDYGATVRFEGDFVDHNLNDITWWTDKHNRYATRQMVDFINLEFSLFPVADALPVRGAGLKRFLRNRVFANFPLYIRSLLYFFMRYIVLLGFLDGRQGLVFHFLQGCWNWMLIDAKIEEARRHIQAHGVESFREHLRSKHNIEI